MILMLQILRFWGERHIKQTFVMKFRRRSPMIFSRQQGHGITTFVQFDCVYRYLTRHKHQENWTMKQSLRLLVGMCLDSRNILQAIGHKVYSSNISAFWEKLFGWRTDFMRRAEPDVWRRLETKNKIYENIWKKREKVVLAFLARSTMELAVPT